jgi:hypothetical protein
VPRLIRGVQPVGQEHRHPARPQVRRGLLHDGTAEVVGPQRRLAVGVAGVRGDDERRVGHDQVERVRCDRVEQRSGTAIEGRAGQDGGQLRHGQGAPTAVGGHHSRAVPGGQKRLQSAAGPQIQRLIDRIPRRDGRQCDGRAPDPHHVIGPQAAPAGPAHPRRQIGHHESVARRRRVGLHVHPGPDLLGAALSHLGDESQQFGILERHGLLQTTGRHHFAEQEEPDQIGQPVVGPIRQGVADRCSLPATERGEGLRTERRQDPIGGEPLFQQCCS